MKMQMLAVLVAAKIGKDSAPTPLQFNLLCYLPDNAQHCIDDLIVTVIAICERWNVFLWYNHDMKWPVWLGVMIGENLIVFILNAKIHFLRNCNIAVEVVTFVSFHMMRLRQGTTSIRLTPFGAVSPFQMLFA